MVIRYATSIEDGLNVSCLNICCAPENVVEKLKERYYSKCNSWIIAVEVDDSGTTLYLNEDYKFKSSKAESIKFKSKKEAEELLDKVSSKDCEVKVVPLYPFTLSRIGSSNCEHCPFCYGRSNPMAEFEMVGWNTGNGNGELKVREANYIKCSAVYSELNWKIKLKRWFYQLWVNKCERPLIDFTRKYNIKPLYTKLAYGSWKWK